MRAGVDDREIRYVEWIDSSSGSGWEKLTEIRGYDAHFCCSVGFVLADTDEHIVLIQSLDDQEGNDQHGDNFISIPKIAIRKARVLRRAR